MKFVFTLAIYGEGETEDEALTSALETLFEEIATAGDRVIEARELDADEA